MKLVIVTDPHLVLPGQHLFGRDPRTSLDNCIATINRQQSDADLVVFAGDLTNDGEALAYEALKQSLGALQRPFRLMMGNHDDRTLFREWFPDHPAADGFIQASIDLGAMRVITLDTLEPGQVPGHLCETRLNWLDAELAGAQNALIVMHHPPCAIGIESLDDSRLNNADQFMSVLQRHGNVRHILAGHVHRLANGIWNGIPFTTLRSINHQTSLKFQGQYEISFEQPAYAVVTATENGLVVHHQDIAAA